MGKYWELQRELGNGTFENQLLTRVAFDTKKAGVSELKKEVGGDLRLRNYPRGTTSTRLRRPRKASIFYRKPSAGDVSIFYKPAGMWVIVEHGAGSHRMGGGAGRATRRGTRIGTRSKKQIVMPFGDGKFGTRAIHPGAKPLGKPLERSQSEIPEFFYDANEFLLSGKL